MKRSLIAWILLAAAAAAPAAVAPEYLNYQGVLRDADDVPLDGDYPMTFTFWDAETLGNHLLEDRHSGSTTVTVTGGLFSVHLGGGVVNPGVHGSLAEVFANEPEVWLQIRVVDETLTPRVRIVAAGYALNASNLGGRGPSGFLDTSETAQTKSGQLSVESTSPGAAITGRGVTYGGHFEELTGTSEAWVAARNIGLRGWGNQVGGRFTSDGTGHAELASGDVGIIAWGSEYAGFFDGALTASTVEADGIELRSGEITFPDGSVQSSSAAGLANLASRPDSAGEVGRLSSVAVGIDGLPIVSYFDNTNGDLKVAHCDNALCSSATVATLDTAGDVGRYTSIAIGSDGVPIVSYYDLSNGDLKVAHCDDALCSTAAPVTLDGAATVGLYNSIAVGSDGVPVISYYDTTSDDLKLAHCDDVLCSGATLATVDSIGDVGRYTSIAIGGDGFPVISYYNYGSGDLKAAHCDDLACSAATVTTLESTGLKGSYSSIAIGSDGLPIISYFDNSADDLKVAHCDDALCSGATLVTLDSDGSVGEYTSITIGSDGLAVIGYHDVSNGDLKAAFCDDLLCSSATIATLDSAGFVGEYTSIALGSDGKPVISYFDLTNGDLKVMTQVTLAAGAAEASRSSTAHRGTLREVNRTGEPAGERTVLGGSDSRSTGIGRTAVSGVRTDEEGNVYARSFRPSASDLASTARIAERVEPGDVLVIDPARPGLLALARAAYDTAVFGIVAGEPGVVLGAAPPGEASIDERPEGENAVREARPLGAPEGDAALARAPVAVSGIAPCKVDAEYGSIRPGDLLTTSPTPGHAMLAYDPQPGTILGKALEPLDAGTGSIRVLVMLR